MKTYPILRLAVPLLLAAALARPLAAQEATVVILVRHAEKQAQPASDPPLTAEGEARARALAFELADAHVDAVITTQFARTRLTGWPLADAMHITPTVIPAATSAADLAATIRGSYAGRTVLVVGHSNTIPRIITALGGPPLADFCDNQYDGLYTVFIRANGTVSLVRSHFGAANGPAPAGCEPTMTPRP